jgi:hypothetical protein
MNVVSASERRPNVLSDARSRPISGPAPELQVAGDLAKRAIPVAPVLLVVAAIGWGWSGVASSAIGIGLVVVNFIAAAAIIASTIRVSLNALMAGVLFGFLLRLTLLTVAVVLLRKLDFVDDIPLLFTVLITHIGLLVWETRFVSMSLAYPGLKPRARTHESVSFAKSSASLSGKEAGTA